MELASEVSGARRRFFFFYFLVVASYSSNETVAANCDVWGAVVVLAFGCRFMMPIFIFNIDYLAMAYLLLSHYFTYTAFQFNQVGWCFLVMAIAYFCPY